MPIEFDFPGQSEWEEEYKKFKKRLKKQCKKTKQK